MTAAQTLSAARELMLHHHGPQCAQRPHWEELAALLAEAEADAVETQEGNGVSDRPLAIADHYLHTSTIKECAHG